MKKHEVNKLLERIGNCIVVNHSDVIFQDMDDILNSYIKDVFQQLILRHGSDISDEMIESEINDYFNGMYYPDSEGENDYDLPDTEGENYDDVIPDDIEMPEYYSLKTKSKQQLSGMVDPMFSIKDLQMAQNAKNHKGIIVDLD